MILEKLSKLDAELLKYTGNDEDVTHIAFPVTKYPEKATLTLDKNPQIEEKLVGIKRAIFAFW